MISATSRPTLHGAKPIPVAKLLRGRRRGDGDGGKLKRMLRFQGPPQPSPAPDDALEIVSAARKRKTERHH
jgi:hypothetical protein